MVGRDGQELAVGDRQLERLGQHPDRRQPRRLSSPLLYRRDRGGTDTALLGECLLSETGRNPEPAQQFAKGTGHYRSTPLPPDESRAPPTTSQATGRACVCALDASSQSRRTLALGNFSKIAIFLFRKDWRGLCRRAWPCADLGGGPARPCGSLPDTRPGTR